MIKNLKNKFIKNKQTLALVFTSFIFIFSLLTANNNVHDAELRYTEMSNDKNIIGSIVPASCESNLYVSNGDGNYSGCATQTCWNGTTITPAAGESCPPVPHCGAGSLLVSQCTCNSGEIKESPYYAPPITYTCSTGYKDIFPPLPDNNNMCTRINLLLETVVYPAQISNYTLARCVIPALPTVNIRFE